MSLRAAAISVVRDGVPVLAGIEVVCHAGEVLGIVGPNGAGKSTLLAVLAGLLQPQTGKCVVDSSRDIAALALDERARRVAFLPQSQEIHWPLSVRHVVALGRYPHTTAGAVADHRAVERAMRVLSVDRLAERNVLSLSAGERARVLLARALAVEADYLLCDEPIAALDPYNQLQALDVLRAEAADGRGVCLVLHDMALAARYCDRLVLLSEGRVHADGEPMQVLSRANLQTVYRVEGLFGEAEGAPYLLPWRRVD